jgi:hypothetical protein
MVSKAEMCLATETHHRVDFIPQIPTAMRNEEEAGEAIRPWNIACFAWTSPIHDG